MKVKFRLTIKPSLKFTAVNLIKKYSTNLLLLPSKDVYWFPCECRAEHARDIAKLNNIEILEYVKEC